jgi:hypothetical protein
MSVLSYSPSVSVIIPAHNAEKTLERAVVSVFSQTLPVDEILIFDDASSDGTSAEIMKLQTTDPRIKAFFGESNKGAGHARGFLLKRAIGEFAAFLDADDSWHPQKLEAQMPMFVDAAVGICATNFRVLRNNRRITERSAPARFGSKRMHLANYIGMSTAIVRLDLNGSREMPVIRKRQDYAYWLSILRLNPRVRVATVNEPLVEYHVQENSLSSDKLDNVRWNYAVFRETQGYSRTLSAILTLGNIAFRMLR